jgi:hypothetical protein
MSFTQRDVGDVLVTFENEAIALINELGSDKFEIVYPSLSIDASVPVAIVSTVVDKKNTRKQATAYLNFLFSPEGQAIIVRHHFRPRDQSVLANQPGRFPAISTFSVDELGGWPKIQAASTTVEHRNVGKERFDKITGLLSRSLTLQRISPGCQICVATIPRCLGIGDHDADPRLNKITPVLDRLGLPFRTRKTEVVV